MKPSLVSGERFYSLSEANLIKELFTKASQIFESYGYEYVTLSHFEPYEFQELAFGEKAKEAITFKDTSTGETLSLRLDFTTQVVRTVSLLHNLKLPERLYYFGNTFSLGGESYEKLQAGLELLGVPDIKGDLEIIEILFRYLRSLGFKKLKVIISHAEIVQKLTGGNQEKRIAFYERNYEELRSILKEKAETFLKVTERGEELKILEELGLEKEAEILTSFGKALREKGIPFLYDLCEVRDFPYYDGIIFEIYDEESKLSLAGGGRYNKLTKLYGKEIPATGGAIYLEKLLDLLNGKPPKKDYYIIDLSQKRLGEELADILRGKGKKVAIELLDRNVEVSIRYAFEKGFREVLLLEDDILKVYTTPQDFVVMHVKDFLKLL
ncbi:ATP phosphoribosyltransferase regulatory subunit [Aquifex sp.]